MTKKILLAVLVVIVLGVGFGFFAARTPSTVIVEHTLSAPLTKVWKLWIDAEAMKKWWGPKDFTAPVIQNDFKVGGSFLLSMKAPDGKMFWNTGKYIEIVPFEKIVSSMSFSDETGRVFTGSEIPVPGKWPDAVTVTVEFKEMDGKTHVLIQEEGIPLLMKVMAKMGWEQQFDKLDSLLE